MGSKKSVTFKSMHANTPPLKIELDTVSFLTGKIGSFKDIKLNVDEITMVELRTQVGAALPGVPAIFINTESNKYNVVGPFTSKTIKEIFLYFNLKFKNKFMITPMKKVKYFFLIRKIYFGVILFANAIVVLFVFLRFQTPWMSGKHDNFIKKHPEIKRQVNGGSSRILVPCPRSEHEFYSTNDPDKFLYVHFCRVLNFEFAYDVKEISFLDGIQLYGEEKMKQIKERSTFLQRGTN
jgi:hypothetical protein